MSARFVVATVLGSALLFLVQPMVARMLLPVVGGVPALWNTCMVFFQLALLAGYAYSHALPSRMGPRAQSVVHLALLALAGATLPMTFAALPEPPAGDPTLWVLRALALRVAPVFVLLSTGAPLLQRWFVGASQRDPARLIAASNVGSLAALLGYPLVVERVLPLGAQSKSFAALYAVYVVAVAASALTRGAQSDGATREAAVPVPAATWWRWVALAFVPSSMMLGVTAHLATDVGSFPLMWVVPLAIYLGSFIAVFARPPSAPSPRVVAPYLGLLLLMFLFTAPQVATRWPLVVGHLALFAWCAWMLHGALARARPTDASITAFQLSLAVGGALGGVFNALVAPHVFSRVTEYPLVMALSILLLPEPPPPPDPRAREEAFLRAMGLDPTTVLGEAPAPRAKPRWRAGDVMVPVLVWCIAAMLFVAPTSTRAPSLVRYGVPLMALVLLSVGRRARLTLGLLALLTATRLDRAVVHAERTFYGVLRVEDHFGVRRFLHGTALHGLQYLDAKRRDLPVAYYAPGAPIGRALAALPLDGQRVGVVGLGAGMLLAHAHAGQQWTFYELDPAVERVARTYFTWLRDARAPWRIVLGDARRTLREDREARYRVLLLDAFSSDAIPVHLLTREALRLYLARVDAHGVIAFHVTNRHVRLEGQLAALARDAGLVTRFRRGEAPGPDGPVVSAWALMARRDEDLGALARDPGWTPLGDEGARPWRDDMSDALSVMRWR